MLHFRLIEMRLNKCEPKKSIGMHGHIYRAREREREREKRCVCLKNNEEIGLLGKHLIACFHEKQLSMKNVESIS